jgi:hypothetical protein
MSTKAKLIVVLKAGETIVAEVEDPILWQQVLTVINQGSSEAINVASKMTNEPKTADIGKKVLDSENSAMSRFAKSLGVSEDELVGAVSPSMEAPYLQLNHHCWEAMKKKTPSRGRGSLNATAVAGTLLSLWFKEADLGHPTQAQAGEVLDAINVKDPNPSRGIKNTKWLSPRRGGVILLNPAKISEAQLIAKEFCLKEWAVNNK